MLQHPLKNLKLSEEDAKKIEKIKEEYSNAENRFYELEKMRDQGNMTDEQILEYDRLSTELFSDSPETFSNRIDTIIQKYINKTE